MPVDFLFMRKSDVFDPGGIFFSHLAKKVENELSGLSYEIICHGETFAKKSAPVSSPK